MVDRITIYRMLESGRLPGFKVGGHWRFARADIEAWIEQQRGPAAPAPTAASPGSAQLPLSCMEPIQAVFAEALDVCVFTADPAGTPLTPISHPCDYCQTVQATPEGRRACAARYAELAAGDMRAPLRCHAGLRLHGARVLVGGEYVAAVVAAGFVAGRDELAEVERRLPAVAESCGVDEAALRERLASVYVKEPAELPRLERLLAMVAGTYAELVKHNRQLTGRLQRIADIAALE